ncbi:MAG TPA: glycoside hydrolase domain-containing protein [Streptosporangiaceae bacterium]
MSHRTSMPARALAAGCLLTAGTLLAGAGADAALAGSPVPGPAALTAASVAGRAAPAWQQVSYRGVRLRVPASWPVVNLARHPRACPRLDVHAVYLGRPGPDPSCPAGLQGKTEAVALTPVSVTSPDLRQANRRTRIGGRPAQTNADAAISHTITDILPSAGVEVSLSYGSSPALARSIQSTITITGRAAAAAAAPASITPAAITPAAPQSGVVKGPGFDTCAAPSAATMKRWLASPYRSVGIYIGGVNRACAQSSLTASWIKTIQAEGWHYFPFYVGLQASCAAASGLAKINSGQAAAQGRAAANDAVTQAASVGIPSGTPIIYDMEAYRSGCTKAVTTFLSAWDSQLHARGYVAGIYESFSNISDLVGAASQMTEPDIIHYADWDGHATTSSSYMPATMWTSHQRIHQYKGGHNETYGGTTVNIDNDQLDVTLSGTPTGGGGGGGGSALRPSFRIAVALNANTSAEWFARAANGTVRHNYQHPIGSASWSATRAVGNSPASLAGNPAVAANADGTLALFTRTRAGAVRHAWQQDGAPNDWQWGGSVGGGRPPGGATGSPGAVRMAGGEVAVFATTGGGGLAWTRQRSPGGNSSWTAWASLGGSCASTPVPFVTSGRKLAVFCRTAAGRLAVREQSQGRWGSWATISGGPARVAGMPAVISAAGGQTEVFTRTSTGQLGYAWQAASGWNWGSSPTAGTRVRNSPTAVPWPGGGIGVLAQQSNGQLGYAIQEGSGAAGWGTWMQLSSHMLGSPTAWANAGGQPEVAILTKQLKVAVSTYANSQWSAWTRLGGGY